MLTVDLTKRELEDIKLEINSFIEQEFGSFNELQKNHIKFVLKKIVFLKYITRQLGKDFRFQVLISDNCSIKRGEKCKINN